MDAFVFFTAELLMQIITLKSWRFSNKHDCLKLQIIVKSIRLHCNGRYEMSEESEDFFYYTYTYTCKHIWFDNFIYLSLHTGSICSLTLEKRIARFYARILAAYDITWQGWFCFCLYYLSSTPWLIVSTYQITIINIY